MIRKIHFIIINSFLIKIFINFIISFEHIVNGHAYNLLIYHFTVSGQFSILA